MPNQDVAEISGSFLGRMMFKFILVSILFACSTILINNYKNGVYTGSMNDTLAVSFGSIGIIISLLSLILLVGVDINGWRGLEGFGIYQGMEFCLNKTGAVRMTPNGGLPSLGRFGGGSSRSSNSDQLPADITGELGMQIGGS